MVNDVVDPRTHVYPMERLAILVTEKRGPDAEAYIVDFAGDLFELLRFVKDGLWISAKDLVAKMIVKSYGNE